MAEAVIRGGNWSNGANEGVFCANLNNAPGNTNNNIGFRCCSSLVSQTCIFKEMKAVQYELHRFKSQLRISRKTEIQRLNIINKKAVSKMKLVLMNTAYVN